MDFIPFEEDQENKNNIEVDNNNENNFLPFEPVEEDTSVNARAEAQKFEESNRTEDDFVLEDLYNNVKEISEPYVENFKTGVEASKELWDRTAQRTVEEITGIPMEKQSEFMEKEVPSTGDKTSDMVADVTGNIAGSLTKLMATSSLINTGIGASSTLTNTLGKLPSAAERAIRTGTTFTGVEAINDITQEDTDSRPLDYTEAFLSGAALGGTGEVTSKMVRQLSTEVPISETVYPFIEKIASGVAAGGARTGVQKAFNPAEVDMEDLGLNMAVTALWYTVPLIDQNKRQQINNARNYLIQQKNEVDNKAINALRKLGVRRNASKQDIKKAWNAQKARTTKGDFSQLSEKQKLRFLSDTKAARDKALQYVSNAPISTQLKNKAISNLNKITTSMRRIFANPQQALVPPTPGQSPQTAGLNLSTSTTPDMGAATDVIGEDIATGEGQPKPITQTDQSITQLGQQTQRPIDLEGLPTGPQTGQEGQDITQQGDSNFLPLEPQNEGIKTSKEGIEEIPISEIYPHHDADTQKVEEFINMYSENKNYPPIKVQKFVVTNENVGEEYYIGDNLWKQITEEDIGKEYYSVEDGIHRLAALDQTGQDTIKIDTSNLSNEQINIEENDFVRDFVNEAQEEQVEGVPENLQPYIKKIENEEGIQYGVIDSSGNTRVFNNIRDAINIAQKSQENIVGNIEPQQQNIVETRGESLNLNEMTERSKIFAEKYNFFDTNNYSYWVTKNMSEFKERNNINQNAPLTEAQNKQFNEYLRNKEIDEEIAQNISEIKQQKAERLNQAEEQKEIPELNIQAEGKTSEAATPDNTEIETKLALVNANDLVTSHDTALNVNENFPQELQPRQRNREATKAQIEEIVNKMNPKKLGDTYSANTGAPIVGPEGYVEAGNARTISLKRLYNENRDNAETYREWLKDNAEQFGLTQEQVENTENPVLVRVRQSDINREQFVQEANREETASMSASEQAMVDSKNIDTNLLSEFVPHDEGLINTAANRQFITDFLDQVVGQSAKNEYVDSEGNLNQAGIKRVENALFASAYGDPSVMEELAESTSSNIKNITGAMLDSAPRMVKIQNQIEQGELHELDISDDLTDAARLYKSIKASDKSIDEYFKRDNLWEEKDYTPVQEELVKMFEENKYSRKKMREILVNYTYGVEKAGKANMDRMFNDVETASKQEVLKAAEKAVLGSDDVEQTAIGFDSKESPTKSSQLSNRTDNTGPQASKSPGQKSMAERKAEINENLSGQVGDGVLKQPEIVELVKRINDGKVPHIKERIGKDVLGRFLPKSSDIQLRADLFLGERLETKVVKPSELDETIENLQEKYADQDNIEIRESLNKQKRRHEIKVYRKDPDYAARTLSHEIGHLIDYLPDETMNRGNILGRVASLKNHLTHGLESNVFSGQYNRDTIMNELKDLSQKWKPFDESGDRGFTQYRYSSSELYADAISVLLNNPQMLKQEAPTFYKAFNEYLNEKPQVDKVYSELQERIKYQELVNSYRLENFREMSKKGNEARIKNKEKEGHTISGIDAIMRGLVDEDWGIIKYTKGEAEGDLAKIQEETRNQIEESRYIEGQIDNYFYDLYNRVIKPLEVADLSKEDLGMYMFFKRVINERSDMANPLGHNEETARKALEKMREELTQEVQETYDELGTDFSVDETVNNIIERLPKMEKYEVLEEVADEYSQMRRKELIPKVEDSGLYTDELLNLMKENEHYAKFNVQYYMDKSKGSGDTARVYRQIGTLSEIENPFIATVMQDISMLRAAKMNEAKKATINLLTELENGPVKKADTNYIPNRGIVPKESSVKNEEILTVMKDGERVYFYVPKNIADSFKYNPVEAKTTAETWGMIMSPVRDILVSKNPMWMVRNVIRDFRETAKKLPEVHVKDYPKLMKYYKEAYKEAWQEVMKGKRSEDVRTMMENYMLSSERMYSRKDAEIDDAIDRIVNEYDLNPEEDMNSEKFKNRFKNFIEVVKEKEGLGNLRIPWDLYEEIVTTSNLYQSLDRLGRISEITGQIAGYKYLRDNTDLSTEEIGHKVRTQVGTPDFKRKGKWNSVTNNVFLYSNIAKESIRSTAETIKSNPGEYAWKTIVTNFLPKFALRVLPFVIAGLMGKDKGKLMKRIIDGATEYDKRNYTIVPLGITDEGKSIYLRIPDDYEGQIFGAMAYDLANMNIKGKESVLNDITKFNPYGSNFTPDNPYYQAVSDFVQYKIKGRIPYDDYRGRLIFPEWLEGNEADKAFWKHEWQTMGGGVIFDPYYGMKDFDGPIERSLQTFPGNILGTFFKITDYGHQEGNDNNTSVGY